MAKIALHFAKNSAIFFGGYFTYQESFGLIFGCLCVACLADSWLEEN